MNSRVRGILRRAVCESRRGWYNRNTYPLHFFRKSRKWIDPFISLTDGASRVFEGDTISSVSELENCSVFAKHVCSDHHCGGQAGDDEDRMRHTDTTQFEREGDPSGYVGPPITQATDIKRNFRFAERRKSGNGVENVRAEKGSRSAGICAAIWKD